MMQSLNKRALFAAGAVIALLLLAVGCGGGDGTTAEGDAGEPAATAPSEDTGTTASSDSSGGIGPGITTPKPLPPYKPSEKAGEKPDVPGVVAYVQASPRGYSQLVGEGVEEGAEDGGLEYKVAQSEGDIQAHVQSMEQFLVQGVGALVTDRVEPAAQAPVMLKAMEEGAAMQAIVFGPATTQVDAPQYQGGKKLGELAAEYIENELGGEAKVVILNEDTNEPVRPRFEGIREALATVPGAEIVADVQPEEPDNEHAFETMNTILQKDPEVDVVLGADAVVEGALSALEATNKDTDKQVLGGVDCEDQALALIAEEGPYKACIATDPKLSGYAFGRFAGLWHEGKCVPQGISVEPVAVTNAAEVAKYKAAEADPGPVFEDPQKISEYLGFYGNICYETRDQYLAYDWQAPGHSKEG